MAHTKDLNYSALGFTVGFIGLAVGIVVGVKLVAPIMEKRKAKKLAQVKKPQVATKKG